jgi:hypothetical protein
LVSLNRRREHPLAWLSSHKLGRPFGLAEPVGPGGSYDNVNGFFRARRLQSLATTYSSNA